MYSTNTQPRREKIQLKSLLTTLEEQVSKQSLQNEQQQQIHQDQQRHQIFSVQSHNLESQTQEQQQAHLQKLEDNLELYERFKMKKEFLHTLRTYTYILF